MERLDFSGKIEDRFNKKDFELFSSLLPHFLNVVSKLNSGERASSFIDDQKYIEMVSFLQGREDQEIEALCSAFIVINSENDLGKALNLPQLLESVFRWGKVPEEEINNIIEKRNKNKDGKNVIPKYGYDKDDDKIRGVKTPTTGEILSAKVEDSMMKQEESKILDSQDKDLLEKDDLTAGDIFKRFGETT